MVVPRERELNDARVVRPQECRRRRLIFLLIFLLLLYVRKPYLQGHTHILNETWWYSIILLRTFQSFEYTTIGAHALSSTVFDKSRANVVLTLLLLVGFHAAISPPLRRGWVNKVGVVVVEQWNFPLQIVIAKETRRGTKTSSRDSTFFASSSVNLPLIKKSSTKK